MRAFKQILMAALLAAPLAVVAAEAPAQLHKNPNCRCCDTYAEHLEESGIEVDTIDTHELKEVAEQHGLPREIAGCHVMTLEGYVFSGLIPAEAIRQILAERPEIAGLSLPGMPRGAPGMPGDKQGAFEVYAFGNDADPYVFGEY